MLQRFKEKYRLTLENYLTYKKEIEEGLSYFSSGNADSDFGEKIAALAKRLRDEYPMGLNDVTSRISSLDGMAIGSYVSSFGYSIYGGMDHMTICLRIGATASFWRELLDYLEEDKSITSINYIKKVEDYYAAHMNELDGAVLKSEKGKAFKEAVLSISDSGKAYSAGAHYPRELIAGMERLLALYPDVNALDEKLDGVDGVKQLLKLRTEIYDAVIEVQASFNSYPEEYAKLRAYWEREAIEAISEVPAEMMKGAEDYSREHAKADFDAKIAEYAAELKKAPLAAALAKKIEKARLAIIKYTEKMRAKGKEIDGNKVAKLAMGGRTIYCTPAFEPDLEVTSAYDVVKAATEGTKQDFTELYYISEAKHKLYFENRSNGENYFFSVRYNENFNEYVNNLKLKLAEETSIADKLRFVKNTFPAFYSFVGTPLLDAMVELVYADTFHDFVAVPDEFKTKEALSELCEYFRLMRADSVKESINLYVSEYDMPSGNDFPEIDLEVTLKDIAAMYSHSDYVASLPKKEAAKSAIAAAIG